MSFPVVVLRLIRSLPLVFGFHWADLLKLLERLASEFGNLLQDFRREEEPNESLVFLWNQQSLIDLCLAMDVLVVVQHLDQGLVGFSYVVIVRLSLLFSDEEGKRVELGGVICPSELHRTTRIVDVPEPSPLLLLRLAAIHPNSQVLVELVVREQHPAKLADEFDSLQQVVDILLGEEVVETESSESHSEQLLPVDECLLVLSAHLKVDAEDLLPIDGATHAARSSLDSKQVTQELSHKRRMQDLAFLGSDDERVDVGLRQSVVPE